MPTKYKSAPTGRVFNTKKEAQQDAYSYHVAKRLSEQTRNITLRYISGKPDEVRAKYWAQEPVMQHAVDSIAGRYGIDSDALKYRLNHEGFVDKEILNRNYPYSEHKRGYAILNGDNYISGAVNFGLDDVGTMIKEGKVHPINESWGDEEFINESGRWTHAAAGNTVADNIGLVAATLKYFKDTAKTDNPNISDYDLNRYALAYYNRGVGGGRKWVNNGANGYNYRRRLESRGSKTK